MVNYFDKIKAEPTYFRQISVDEQLITQYECPIDIKKATIWTHQSYFVYVLEGKKIWHSSDASFELTQGKCLFVKKGAHIIEQFFDSRFCVIMFFVSEKFISEVLTPDLLDIKNTKGAQLEQAMFPVNADEILHAFFNSVAPFFLSTNKPNNALLELKFKELILNVVSNPINNPIKKYFSSVCGNRSSENMKRIMEENFKHNLSLKEFARLCGKSLSAFKRDFEDNYGTTPGKWLLARRLQYANVLIRTTKITISEAAFSCGFENISHFSRVFKAHFGHSPSSLKGNV